MYCVEANVGDRIEMHPGTTAWMQGDRYGTIVRKWVRGGLTRYKVNLDKSGVTTTVPSYNIQTVL